MAIRSFYYNAAIQFFLMNYPVESLRGKTISVINAYSFENSNITYIAMGDSVRTLGWHAFNGCGALRSADIGSGLDFIYSEAFNNCPELRSFYTTTQKAFLNGKYYNPFTGSTKNVTVYGYHDAHLHSKVAGVPYVGIDRHSEPTWSWSEDLDSATAHFKCSRCSIDKSVMTDDIDTVYSTDKTVYTASVVDGLESYTSSAEGGRTLFTGHSLSLNGSIGVNFYINLTEEEAKDATVRFTWTVEGNEKSHTVSLKDAEKHPLGYKATCPIAIAEMTYNINATLTLGDEVYNDTYSAINYADEILYSDDFAGKYVAEENESGKNGEARLQQLQQLVKTMLDYGAKAQLRFERNTDYLANDGEDFFSDEVTLTDQSSDMNEHLGDVGLEYMGTSVVYLSGTTLRHYYKIVDPDKFTDQVKNSVTFNGEAVKYGEKDGLIYFDKKNIAAPELDVQYVISIGGHGYHYSALDYSALSYNADEKPYSESIAKQLAASVYRYNQAANVYFEG